MKSATNIIKIDTLLHPTAPNLPYIYLLQTARSAICNLHKHTYIFYRAKDILDKSA